MTHTQLQTKYIQYAFMFCSNLYND